ncbi:deoxyribose-phosphate aldolase [Roseivirga sp. 4D4]|uniref:deoxyribose-phosphate aldolase n=1 Tax=Roseivirga sp. 4D4 TaxID=1889784 RepID=UPI0008538C94|nr:deoxyribose-phosphate aldolase [Roseivirga sp. 4D4]OEK03167.1 deoxyribose-phosphate aldolase [Roseivirga sp. 4D4]
MDINRYIEHTDLKPNLVDKDIDLLVQEAIDHRFVGVCVPPFWVKRAAREIADHDVQLVTVVGFPLGYQMTQSKLIEIETAIEDGAQELDIVMNISAFKSGMPWVKIELAKCANLIHQSSCIMKVILETAYLAEEEIITATKLACEAGTDFVKTSTGFAASGAQTNHITLMRENAPSNVGIKASGGIRDLDTLNAMVTAGADRVGTSSGVEIMAELADRD